MNNRVWKKEKELITALLEDYPNYQSYIEQRKYELEHPISPIDENVGGGKAQFRNRNEVLHMLITIDEDFRLNELRRIHHCIRICLDEASDDVRKICEELYFKKYRDRKYHAISDLCDAHIVYTGKTKAYDEFNDFLKDVASELGLPR